MQRSPWACVHAYTCTHVSTRLCPLLLLTGLLPHLISCSVFSPALEFKILWLACCDLESTLCWGPPQGAAVERELGHRGGHQPPHSVAIAKSWVSRFHLFSEKLFFPVHSERW